MYVSTSSKVSDAALQFGACSDGPAAEGHRSRLGRPAFQAGPEGRERHAEPDQQGGAGGRDACEGDQVLAGRVRAALDHAGRKLLLTHTAKGSRDMLRLMPKCLALLPRRSPSPVTATLCAAMLQRAPLLARCDNAMPGQRPGALTTHSCWMHPPEDDSLSALSLFPQQPVPSTTKTSESIQSESKSTVSQFGQAPNFVVIGTGSSGTKIYA